MQSPGVEEPGVVDDTAGGQLEGVAREVASVGGDHHSEAAAPQGPRCAVASASASETDRRAPACRAASQRAGAIAPRAGARNRRSILASSGGSAKGPIAVA